MGICTERLRKEDPELVWVSHDESIFYSNGDWAKGWGSEEHPDIHKKEMEGLSWFPTLFVLVMGCLCWIESPSARLLS